MEVGLVRQIDIDREMQQSYLDYAMSVIVARALPDARDGLKPVHRRILHAMYSMGIRSNTAFKKSARIVGEVLGKYHPHGDMAVYDAMVRMAQDFSMRYPVIEGQGNFGSMDGDPPAAMRYTEARMSPLAMEMLEDLDKDTVTFLDNFDGSLREPTVLPAAVPNLLLNGATGIAVGMATSIPPHNMDEVCDALIYMLENWSKSEEITLGDLMKFIKGPDFPTGGIILHRSEDPNEGITAAYSSGRGKITLQARAHIEAMGRGRSRIIVTELPYQTNKSSLIERIAELARGGSLEGISDLRDESDRQGMRIVIELSKSADPEKILLQLYRRTPMQGTFSVIMLALVDGEPRLLNLKQALRVYLDHRIEIVRRRSQYQLEIAKKRLHILEGLRVALKNLDEIIRLIRAAKDADQARERLIKRFKISEIQANAILEMPLRRLAGLERKKIELEYKETMASIKALEDLLASGKKIRGAITNELQELKTKYGDARRTRIVERSRKGKSAGPITAKDVAVAKDTWVVITKKGLISKTPTARLPGISGRSAPEFVIGAGGRDQLYLFDDRGRGVSIPLHVIPESSNSKDGMPIRSLSAFDSQNRIAGGLALSKDLLSGKEGPSYIVFCSKNGMIKKSELSLLPGPSAKAFSAFKVAKGDALGWVGLTGGKDEILLVSRKGMAIRFSEKDVRPMGLSAAGVQGMKLVGKDDRIVLMGVIRPKQQLLLISEDGLVKRTNLNEYPRQGRYGKGVLTWKSGEAVALVGGGIGPPEQRGAARFSKAPSRSIRYGDAVRRSRTAAGKAMLETQKQNRIADFTPVISKPEVQKAGASDSSGAGKRARKKATAASRPKKSGPKASSSKPKKRSKATKTKSSKAKSRPQPKAASRSQTKKKRSTKKAGGGT